MAKMFYTLTEVCEKLSMSETEVEAMVASGQIQEFRDSENLVFKVEQIELLTPNDDSGELDLNLDLDSSSLELDDSFGLGESATGSIGLAGSQSADIPTPAAAPDLSGGIDESGSGIGLGGGIYALGALSDFLVPFYGDEALRYSMLYGLALYGLAALLMAFAGPSLRKDWVAE